RRGGSVTHDRPTILYREHLVCRGGLLLLARTPAWSSLRMGREYRSHHRLANRGRDHGHRTMVGFTSSKHTSNHACQHTTVLIDRATPAKEPAMTLPMPRVLSPQSVPSLRWGVIGTGSIAGRF